MLLIYCDEGFDNNEIALFTFYYSFNKCIIFFYEYIKQIKIYLPQKQRSKLLY